MTLQGPWIPACERDPIQAPGETQSWGALLVADAHDLRVRHASANLAAFIDCQARDAIGRPIVDLPGLACLGPLIRERALERGEEPTTIDPPPLPGGRALSCTYHYLGGMLYAELEPALPPVPLDGRAGVERWHDARRISATLCAASGSDALFRIAVTELRRVTGFERTMLYRFDPFGHGEVLAEECAPEFDLDPFLGCHFPASDVPRHARALYLRQRLRVVADVDAPAVPLLGAPGLPTPDLSLSTLRAVAPIHLEYMRNMRIRGTAVVSLIVGGTLWGLLVAHHRAPCMLSPVRRGLCDLMGQVVSLMIATLHDIETRHEAAHRRTRVGAIAARIAELPDGVASLGPALADVSSDVLALSRATGAIIRAGGRMTSLGDAPQGAPAEALLGALLAARTDGEEVLTSHEIGALLGDAVVAAGHAGAMLMPVGHYPGDAVVWLRPELTRIVRWGGKPPTLDNFDPETELLHPRRSFALWQEEVGGQSQQWQPDDLQAARDLGREIDKALVTSAEKMRLARDAADRASRAKSDFLATMSHEIRSPMSGLLGVLELLRATQLDPEQARMADMIHNSASMLLAVLNDILDFSKIEAGALSIQHAPVELRALLEDVVQPHDLAGRHRQIAVSLSVAPGVPDRVMTDPLRLRQVLCNLMSNAMKFTMAGEVAMRVTALPADQDHSGARLSFALRDTGIGIAPDVLARLFKPFTQADGSTTRNFGGTGLGLSISSKLAALLNGDITVTSRKGEGSEFTLIVPLIPCKAADEPPAIEPPPPVASRHVGARILVVDDDATIRWLLQRQLEKLGHRVASANNGQGALQLLLEGSYEMVMTDCHMPVMDGVALTQALRGLDDAALQSLPIIGLTADVTENQRAACQSAGMSELVIKPLSIDRLKQLVARHLKGDAEALAGDAPSAPSRPVFDDQIYLSTFERVDEEGAAWLNDYLGTVRRDDATLAGLLPEEGPDTGAAGYDAPKIAKVAHKLAGASLSAGAVRLGEAARALEMAALRRDPPAVLRALQGAMHNACAATESAITEFLAPQPEHASD